MVLKGYEEVASVRFVEGYNPTKVYNFALYDRAVNIGDYALVKSNNGYGLSNFGVVEVVGITPAKDFKGSEPTAEIICKVDVRDYTKRVAMRKERDAIKKKMDKMVKEGHELTVYEIIAAENTKMAELLVAYNSTLGA